MSREQALAAAEATAAELRHTCDSLTRKAGNLASALEVGLFFLFFSAFFAFFLHSLVRLFVHFVTQGLFLHVGWFIYVIYIKYVCVCVCTKNTRRTNTLLY